MLRLLLLAWAIVPVFALLLLAIYRLSQHVLLAVESGLALWQWCALLLCCGYMLYAEGYKGFHKSFAPRFAARVVYMRNNGTRLQRCLAPVFCFGFFGATRRRLIVSYALSAMILSFIIILSYVPQPWRGIVDAGVVAGLVFGLFSMSYFLFTALLGRQAYPYSPEVNS